MATALRSSPRVSAVDRTDEAISATGTAGTWRASARADRIGWLLLAAGAAGTAAYVVSTFGPGRPEHDLLLDHVLFDAVVLALATSIFVGAASAREDRLAWRLIAASFAIAVVAVVLYSAAGGDDATPSLTYADLVRLPAACTYLAGLFLLGHRRTGGVGTAPRLDGAAAALAMAGLALGIISPAVLDAPGGGAVAAVVLVALEMIAVAFAAALIAAYSRAAGPAIILLGLAAASFLAADLNYASLVLRDRWHEGSPTDSLWLVGWVLTALAIRSSPGPARGHTRPAAARDLVTPFTVGAGAFGVIVAAAVSSAPAAAVLGGSALALVGLRLGRTIHERTADLTVALDASERDPLTGIANRRALGAAIARPGTAAILVDLDGFKALNDTHGHLAGDAALREVARVLAEQVRPGDMVGRWGGDEFLVLVRADPAGVPAVVRRIREALERIVIRLDGAEVPVRGSIGVATPGPDLIARADRSLYAAKGRRRP